MLQYYEMMHVSQANEINNFQFTKKKKKVASNDGSGNDMSEWLKLGEEDIIRVNES